MGVAADSEHLWSPNAASLPFSKFRLAWTDCLPYDRVAPRYSDLKYAKQFPYKLRASCSVSLSQPCSQFIESTWMSSYVFRLRAPPPPPLLTCNMTLIIGANPVSSNAHVLSHFVLKATYNQLHATLRLPARSHQWPANQMYLQTTNMQFDPSVIGDILEN